MFRVNPAVTLIRSAHLANVGPLLGDVMPHLLRLEIHGPDAELEKLRPAVTLFFVWTRFCDSHHDLEKYLHTCCPFIGALTFSFSLRPLSYKGTPSNILMHLLATRSDSLS